MAYALVLRSRLRRLKYGDVVDAGICAPRSRVIPRVVPHASEVDLLQARGLKGLDDL